MAHRVKNMTRCEFCGCPVEITSPPLDEYYETNQIHIEKGTILLSERVVKKYHKDGYSDSHCKDIDGYYCNIFCLKQKLIKILT